MVLPEVFLFDVWKLGVAPLFIPLIFCRLSAQQRSRTFACRSRTFKACNSAGVLLKMGGYGFLRFSIPMFPLAYSSINVKRGTIMELHQRLTVTK